MVGSPLSHPGCKGSPVIARPGSGGRRMARPRPWNPEDRCTAAPWKKRLKRRCGFAGVRVGEAQNPGPPCRFQLQGVRDAKLPCIACSDSVRRGYVVHTCQRCGCVSCNRCGPVRRDCTVEIATTPDYVAAGLQDSRTAATLARQDFLDGQRGTTQEAPAQQNGTTPGEVSPRLQDGSARTHWPQATQASAVDWNADASAAPMVHEVETTPQQPRQLKLTLVRGHATGGSDEPPQAMECDDTDSEFGFPQSRHTAVLTQAVSEPVADIGMEQQQAAEPQRAIPRPAEVAEGADAWLACPDGAHDVQQLVGVIRGLAQRIGFLPSQNGIPHQVLRQRWSALYVPWMWAAAEGNEQAPILDWIASTANAVTDVPVAGTPTGGHQAVQAAWEGLCHAYRVWGIHTSADLADWIHAQGFPRPRCGAHFSGKAQERILQEACRLDARAAAIEDVIVRIALEAVRRADSHQQPSQPWSRAQRRRQ